VRGADVSSHLVGPLEGPEVINKNRDKPFSLEKFMRGGGKF